jgi:putative NADH-flavin reductase
MNIALIGASGNVGTKLLMEGLARGHAITGITRRSPLPDFPGLKARTADIADEETLGATLAGHDAVISAVPFAGSDPDRLIVALRRSGVKHYIVAGGAGSLEVAPGLQLVDTPDFPAAYRNEAQRGRAFLDRLREVEDIDWTFVSPSAELAPGARTGRFRLGTDTLLRNANGVSRISQEDLALAIFDEIETPRHIRRRFTVGY